MRLADKIMKTAFRFSLLEMMRANKAKEAMEAIIQHYGEGQQNVSKIYATWKGVRSEMMNNDSYRDPDLGVNILAWLANEFTLSSEDFERVGSYLQLPLRDQYRISSSRMAYLSDPQQDAEFHKIKPIMPSFYEFQLPIHLIQLKTKSETQRNEDKQMHRAKPRAFYHFTKESVNTILSKVLEILERPTITTKREYYDMFNALQIVSGRRNYEIAKALSYRPNDYEYQAEINGLAKKEKGSTEWYTIPLLCKYEVFAEKLDQLRKFYPMGDLSMRQCDSKLSGGIRNASFRLFGRYLIHTQKRNLYGELGWSQRTTNQFMCGEESCSKLVWLAMAFGHVMNYKLLGATQAYQVLIID